MIIEKFDGLNIHLAMSPMEFKLLSLTLGQPHDWAHMAGHMKEAGYDFSSITVRTIIQGIFWSIVGMAAGINRLNKETVPEAPSAPNAEPNAEPSAEPIDSMPDGMTAYPKTDKDKLN